jgi:hypothetical protein
MGAIFLNTPEPIIELITTVTAAKTPMCRSSPVAWVVGVSFSGKVSGLVSIAVIGQ